jgi:lipid-A-disaccharide synthase-like uncharacterized protein
LKNFIEWLEKEKTRTRKLLALITMFIWILSVVASFLMLYYKVDTVAILSLVTAQFATVIAFYMVSKPQKD